MAVCNRGIEDVLTKKAAIVAYNAYLKTKRANPASIDATLGKVVTVSKVSKRGKISKRKSLQLVQSTVRNAPLASLVVNSRRGKAGQPGLYGARMALAIRRLISARKSSIGFLATGWIPAIKRLMALTKQRFSFRKGQAHGEAKGGAVLKGAGFKASIEIFNAIQGGKHASARAQAVIDRGLQVALADEARSMDEYVRKKIEECNKNL
jgi:hypothetical protein